MGPIGARCKYSFTDRKRDLEKSEWDTERFGMVCTKSEYFSNWKTALLKLCDETGRCTVQQKRAIREMGKFIIELQQANKELDSF